jgi:cell division protein FtsL
MRLSGFFDQRIRGFRIVELGAASVLLVLVLVVYLAKTGAGDKSADIDRIEGQITDEQTQIRLLDAELAHEEQPERLASLATKYLGLQPVPAQHEAPAEALPDIANIAAAADAKMPAAGAAKPKAAPAPAAPAHAARAEVARAEASPVSAPADAEVAAADTSSDQGDR